MNETTTKAILDRVDALAAHLNTTAGQLFDVLKHQAFIAAMQDTIGLLFFVGVTAALVKFGLYLRSAEITERENGKVETKFGVAASKCWGWVFVLAFVAALLGINVYLSDVLTEFLNPQYFAIQKLAELLKK